MGGTHRLRTGMELMRTKRVSNVISEDDRFNVRVVSDEKPHPDASMFSLHLKMCAFTTSER